MVIIACKKTARSDSDFLTSDESVFWTQVRYAFENFDPSGAWRDHYGVITRKIPIDASSNIRNGTGYTNISESRKLVLSDANRDRFVRCFVSKLLTYANGIEPGVSDYGEIDKILQVSAEQDYRMIETIAAVIDSPLFRQN